MQTMIKNGQLFREPGTPTPPPDVVLVYEVIRLVSGVPLFLEAHLERLARSLALAGGGIGPEPWEIGKALAELSAACDETDRNLRLDFWPQQGQWQWAGYFVASSYPEPQRYTEGVDTEMLQMARTNPNAKVWQGELKAEVARQCAQKGLFEMILQDHEGSITEGSRSNLFFTRGEALYTARDEEVLGGITRLKLLEMIEQQHIPLMKGRITPEDLETFDGAFLTGTSIHLLPIRRIGSWVRKSPEQPLIKKLMHDFECVVADYIAKAAEA